VVALQFSTATRSFWGCVCRGVAAARVGRGPRCQGRDSQAVPPGGPQPHLRRLDRAPTRATDSPARSTSTELVLGQTRTQGVRSPEKARWQTIRDVVVGLIEPVDGVDADGFRDHRGIPGARAYPKHSGCPSDWPGKTIKAGVHGVSSGEAMIRFDDDSMRYLTVRESARIQGFTRVPHLDQRAPGGRRRLSRRHGSPRGRHRRRTVSVSITRSPLLTRAESRPSPPTTVSASRSPASEQVVPSTLLK
jgi:hypothetical protein